MESFAKDLILVLQYLLPGFISAWIFYSFTSYPKPSQFERVVQALIFTLFVQVIVYFLKSTFFFIGNHRAIFEWDDSSHLTWSILSAIMIGIVFSYYANNDKIHKRFRGYKITRETSYPSEWFGAFQNTTYVVLHLDGERRLYGWPREWPSEPYRGHISLEEASWLDDDNKQTPITGVEKILVDVKNVQMVEFMKKTREGKNG